jgi:hypothetical protein
MGAEHAFGTVGTLFGHRPDPAKAGFGWKGDRQKTCVWLASWGPGARARLQELPPGPKHAAVPAGWGRAAGPVAHRGASTGRARSRSRLSGMGLGGGHLDARVGCWVVGLSPMDPMTKWAELQHQRRPGTTGGFRASNQLRSRAPTRYMLFD